MAENGLLKITNKTVGPFYQLNSDFDVLSFNLYDNEALKNLKWDGLDKERIIKELKAHQRLLRIHPDVTTAQILLENGLDSACKIAALPREHFTQRLANSNIVANNDLLALANGPQENEQPANDQQAVKIYEKAVQIKNKVSHLAAIFRDVLGSSYYRATAFYNLSPELTQQLESLPDYQELFGSLDYFRCNPAYTIFSPSAYFLDLMRITDQYITYPNTIKTDGNIPKGFALQDRRPDLFEMKLDSDNTSKVISYLQLINEILKRRIENEYILHSGTAQTGAKSAITLSTSASPDNGAYNGLVIEITGGTGIGQMRTISSYDGKSKLATVDNPWEIQPDKTSAYQVLDCAYKILSVAGYPFNLPFNLPLQQIRLYLENLNTSLADIYLDFLAPQNTGKAQAGEPLSITLAPGASTVDNTYSGMEVEITGGKGKGQRRMITSYAGTTRKAAVAVSWDTAPDSNSSYRITDARDYAREYLRLALEESKIITTQDASVASLNKYYGYLGAAASPYPGPGVLTFVNGLKNVHGTEVDFKTVLSVGDQIQCGNNTRTVVKIVSPQELLVESEWDVDASSQGYTIIPRKGQSDGGITKAIPYPGPGKITFVNGLKNVHGIEVDFKAVLSVGDQIQCGNNIRTVAKIVSSQELLVEAEWPADASSQGYIISPQDGLNHIGKFLYRTGLTREQMDDLFIQGLSPDELNHGGADQFFINRTDEPDKPVYLHTFFDKSDPGNHCEKILGLTLSRLDRIHRFIRLKQALNWSFKDLDWALVSTGASKIDAAALLNLAQIKLLQAKLKLPVDVLCSFWWNLKTTGKGTDSGYQDLFDVIFNNPALLDGKNPYDPNISPIPFDWSRPLTWDVEDRKGQNGAIRSRLTGSLQVSDNDLTLVARYLLALIGQKGKALEMNLANLTWLYRLTKLPMVFGLTLDQFLTILCLLFYPEKSYLDPPTGILKFDLNHMMALIDWIQWIDHSPFNGYELQYILTARQSDYLNITTKPSDVKLFINNLAVMSRNSLVVPEQFVFEGIDAIGSATIYNQLKAHQFLTGIGVFLKEVDYDSLFSIRSVTYLSLVTSDINAGDAQKAYDLLKAKKVIDSNGNVSESFSKDTDLSFLFTGDDQSGQKQEEVRSILLQVKNFVLTIKNTSFQTNDISLEESTEVFTKLAANNICDASGKLSPDFTSDTSLDFLFDKDPRAVYKRSEVKAALLQFKRGIEHTLEILTKAEKLQETATMAGLAVFLGTTAEMLSVIMPSVTAVKPLDYLKDLLTPLAKGDDVPDKVMTLIIALSRWILLIGKLNLTVDRTKAVMSTPQYFNIDNLTCLTMGNIRSLADFKALVNKFEDTEDALVKYFGMPRDPKLPGPKIGALSKVTGWDGGQIAALIALFWPQDGGPSPDDYTTVAGIKKLDCCFDICASTGCDTYFLQKLSGLSGLALADAGGRLINNNWLTYNDLAQAVLGAVNSKYEAAEFGTIFQKITATLDTMKRDVLLGFSIWVLGRKFSVIKKPTDLYQYLLIDTEMSSCASTSRISQGIASVQLYMQRCRMNLEAGVSDIPIPDAWWGWMSNYRIWEVNRKIFLYPENYIDPTLRKNQTPIFKELADELLQSNITSDTVTAAFNNYFEKFSVVARLVHCASYNCMVTDPKTGTQTETLFLFGRTDTEPYTYYYRSLSKYLSKNTTAWAPWEKIDLTINSPFLSPVFAYNRLFIFWIELDVNKSSSVTGGASQSQTINKATIKYSFMDTRGKWVQPQILAKSDAVSAYPNGYAPLQDNYIKTLFDFDQLYWKQPYVLKIERGIPGPGKITFVKDLQNVHGTNTQFKRQLKVGDSILCSCELRKITKIVSDQEILVDKPWNVDVTNGNYKIIPKDKNTVSFQPFKGAGAISFAQGLPNVQGSGVQFEDQVSVGDRIQCAGDTRTVIKVLPNQQLLMDSSWNSDVKNAEYTIMPRYAGSERLFVFYGAAAETMKTATFNPPDPESNPGKDNFLEGKYDLNRRLYKSLKLAANAKSASITGDVAAGLSYQMGANLAQDECQVLMVDYDAASKGPRPYKPLIERNNCILKVVESANLLSDNYWGNSDYPSTISSGGSLSLLANISQTNSSIANVSNQPGWFIFNNGDESFLVTILNASLGKLSDITIVYPYPSAEWTNGQRVVCGPYSDTPISLSDQKFAFTRLSTNTIGDLSRRLLAGGTDSLLDLTAQQTAELSFARFYENKDTPPACIMPPASNVLDFKGSLGLYFWEIFFHAPFLVADRLNTNQRFEEAKHWYQYIFNPTQKPDTTYTHPNDRFWRFLPFQNQTLQSIGDIFKDPDQIDAYNNDPFDPDVIARLRPSAYPKALAMKYIDNLLDWGDFLFAQDTRESINQAANLYVMVSDLLGKRPETVGDLPIPKAMSFNEIKKQYHGEIPQFIIELENSMTDALNDCEVVLEDIPFNDINSYFGIPENDEFIQYWDRVEDRLYKIRHCLNIQGIERSLALFEPPIDPRQLLRAAISGQGDLSIASQLQPPIPYYRFRYVLEKAKGLVSNLIQVGSSLLSALEKKDAEQLSLLKSVQEKALLNLNTLIKQRQVDETISLGAALEENRNSAKARNDYYSNLLRQGLSQGELANIQAMEAALVFNIMAGITKTLSSIGYAVPNTGSPFAMTYGGREIGAMLNAASGVFEIGSLISSYNAQRSLTMAGYERRSQEWDLQARMAGFDIKQIDAQIAANQIRQQIVQRELEIHGKIIQQNEEIAQYLAGKFTNQELYQWMVSRLSTLYFQTYSIAYDIARSAQLAYQYELDSNQTFVNFGYWDNLHKGLTAGEGLMLALNQMEKAYIDNNSRCLEVEKTISLMQLNPKAMLDFKRTGECIFEFPEKLFDYDYPGHYCRKIKTISISIPAVVGPYQSIKAILTQLGNQTIIKPNVGAVDFLLGGKNSSAPSPDVLRSNWWLNQQIAISRGVNDSGMFELSFKDEQYLPFEGTGAVSTWRLSMPLATNRLNFNEISDVIITLKYTAVNGGNNFRDQVVRLEALKPFTGGRAICLSQEYPEQWYAFMHGHLDPASQGMNFNLLGLIPPNLNQAILVGFYFKLDLGPGVSAQSANDYIKFQVTDSISVDFRPDASGGYTHTFTSPGPALDSVNGNRKVVFDLHSGYTPDNLKKEGFLDPDKIKNITIILYYQGEVSW
ncbi:MAG TPA: neuraminidase-like domain-containing protein [Bacillota bacterium]|nr:neuraminidase-like domain-containing protein [Bacillota bacterium]